jgi:hypothetical protein
VTRNTWILILSIVAVIFLFFFTLALIFGPDLYREGRALLGPITEMAGVKGEFKTLNQEFLFSPPEDGLVSEARLLVFLDIRGELKSVYEDWREVVRTVEKEHPDSWQGAKDVLAVTRDVINAQVEVLRHHGMSAVEFRWLEDRVYEEWFDQVKHLVGDTSNPIVAGQMRRNTEEDLAFVGKLEQQYGSSPVIAAMRRRFEQHLVKFDMPERLSLPDIPEENQQLYWRLKERIADLVLEGYEMHNVYHDVSTISVRPGDVPARDER